MDRDPVNLQGSQCVGQADGPDLFIDKVLNYIAASQLVILKVICSEENL